MNKNQARIERLSKPTQALLNSKSERERERLQQRRTVAPTRFGGSRALEPPPGKRARIVGPEGSAMRRRSLGKSRNWGDSRRLQAAAGMRRATAVQPAANRQNDAMLESMYSMIGEIKKGFDMSKMAGAQIAEGKGDVFLASQLQQLEIVKRDLEEKVGALYRENTEKETALMALRSENDANKRNLKSKMDENDDLVREIERLRKLNHTLEEEAEQCRVTSREQISRIELLTRGVEERDALIEGMRTKLEEDELVRRRLHNQVQDLKGNIRVFCRVRPPTKGAAEIPYFFDKADPRVIEIREKTTAANGKPRLKTTRFSFDHVFGPGSTQDDVFSELTDLVQSVLDGYNCCVFAYGQTGSGKTYTMEGPSTETVESGSRMVVVNEISSDLPDRGVIPRAVDQIFRAMEELTIRNWKYTLSVSFLEVYNEKLRDLLAQGPKGSPQLQIKYDSAGVAYVPDVRTVDVYSPQDVYTLLRISRRNRIVAATKFNDYSSRSHSVFQLHINGVNEKRNETVSSVLNLVDLAGSERSDSDARSAERQKETVNINSSLFNLRKVITALAGKKPHVPYRDSILTQLLQNSLGGNAKMLMFVNVSPNEENVGQSLCSLNFADTANKTHVGTAQRQATKM